MAEKILTREPGVCQSLTVFPDQPNHFQLTVHARERLEAVEVMQRLFEECWQLFRMNLDRGALTRTADENLYDLGQEFGEKISSFAGNVKEVSCAYLTSTTESLQAGFSSSAFNLIKIALKGKKSVQKADKTIITYSRPGPLQYAHYCGALIDVMRELGALDHLLILIDDADLLENEFKNSQESRLERSRLGDAILELSQFAAIDLLVTSRSLYAHSKKEFAQLLDLITHPMKTAELAAIYRAHIRCFGEEETADWSFLTEETLVEAARLAKFLPGIFLQHLRVSFEAFIDQSLEEPQGVDWYLDVFVKRYSQYIDHYPKIKRLIDANRGTTTMEIDGTVSDPIHGTMFDNELVLQSYHNHEVYEILPMMLKVLEMTTSNLPEND